MSETIRLKDASPLVKSVVALDALFADLERIGSKLDDLKIKSEADIDQARKLLGLFAQSGQAITDQVTELSNQLTAARARASEIASRVSEKADAVNAKSADQNAQFERFRLLADKVRSLNAAMSELRNPSETALSKEERQKIMDRLVEFDSQLEPLIDESRELLKVAQESKIKTLEQNADSMNQSLQAVRKKIRQVSSQPIN